MQNYRQLISLQNLEPCKILADRNHFPVLNYFFDRAKELYPEYVHECPFTVRKIMKNNSRIC